MDVSVLPRGEGSLRLHEFRRDGIDQGTAVVDEGELISLDSGEAFFSEVFRAGDGVRAEQIERNPAAGAQTKGDALEAAGFGVERLGFRQGVADGQDL
jgi:hypothetical protein